MARAATAMRPDLFEATRRSLQREPKELPPVWLYDERGSLLYEAITRLPDYYLPRREAEILAARAASIAAQTEARTLIELGSGKRQEHSVPPGRARARALRSLRCQRRMPAGERRRDRRGVSGGLRRADRRQLRARPRGAAHRRPAVDRAPRKHDREPLPPAPGGAAPLLERELREDDALLLGLDLVKDVARLEAAYRRPHRRDRGVRPKRPHTP